MGYLVCACVNSSYKRRKHKLGYPIVQMDGWIQLSQASYTVLLLQSPKDSIFHKHKSLFPGHTVLLCVPDRPPAASPHATGHTAAAELRGWKLLPRLQPCLHLNDPIRWRWKQYSMPRTESSGGGSYNGGGEGDEGRKYNEQRGGGQKLKKGEQRTQKEVLQYEVGGCH